MGPQRLFSRAEQALKDRRYADAIGYARDLIGQSPDFGPAWHLLAVAAAALRDLPLALTGAQEAVRWMPTHTEAWANLGTIRLIVRDPAASVDAYERALALEPARADLGLRLCRALVECGRLTDARARLQALASAPAEALEPELRREAWLALAELELMDGQRRQAVGIAERLLLTAADDVAALQLKARGLKALGAIEAAQVAAARAVELSPSPTARLLLASVLATSPDRIERLRGLELAQPPELRGLDAGQADGLLAELQLGLGQFQDAIGSAERAVALQPTRADWWLHGIDAAQAIGGPQRALKAIETAPQVVQSHPLIGVRHARQLLALGRAGEALNTVDRVLREASQEQEAIALRGLALDRLGHPAEAQRWLACEAFVQASRPNPPPGFRGTEEFLSTLGTEIRRHPSLRMEPLGRPARRAAQTGDLLTGGGIAAQGLARMIEAEIDTFLRRLKPDTARPFLRRLPTRYQLRFWGNRMEAGGELVSHLHAGRWLSGVYFVKLPVSLGTRSDEPSGWLEFNRPPSPLPEASASNLRVVRPEEGVLLLYPAYLWHRTVPFAGMGERISVSFDLLIEG
jgi:uncharacterized protein (TIGR02466 family)